MFCTSCYYTLKGSFYNVRVILDVTDQTLRDRSTPNMTDLLVNSKYQCRIAEMLTSQTDANVKVECRVNFSLTRCEMVPMTIMQLCVISDC